MTRRTYEQDGRDLERADDLDTLVQDKRSGWRATSAKARRRNRRYAKRLTSALRASVTTGAAADLEYFHDDEPA
jgi:hypothetical protein